VHREVIMFRLVRNNRQCYKGPSLGLSLSLSLSLSHYLLRGLEKQLMRIRSCSLEDVAYERDTETTMTLTDQAARTRYLADNEARPAFKQQEA